MGENPHRLRLLAGNLGMVNLLKRSVASMRQGQLDVSQLDYTISFIIVKSGTLDAGFRMIPVGSRGTGAAGGMWRGSQTQTHTLTLNFRPPADPKTCGYRLVEPAKGNTSKRSDIATINELCPQLVVAVQVPPKSVGDPQKFAPHAQGRRTPGAAIRVEPRAKRQGLTPADRRELDNARSRGILQGTLEQLQIEGLAR